MQKAVDDEFDEDSLDQAALDHAKETYDFLHKKGKEFRASVMPHAMALHEIKMMFHNPVTDTFNEKAFGQCCKKRRIVWKRNDRAALLYLAEHPKEAAELLKHTDSESIRLIARRLRRELEGEPEEADDDDEALEGSADDEEGEANDEEGEYEAGDVAEAQADDDASDDADDEGDSEPEELDYDPCVNPISAMLSIGYAWSAPPHWDEVLQSLDPETRELLDTVDTAEALVDLAKALKRARS